MSNANVVVAPAQVPSTIVVLRQSPFRAKSNRQAWYDAVAGLDGQPVADLFALHAASPITCHVRGTKAGQPEDAAEWVGWLCKQGVIGLV